MTDLLCMVCKRKIFENSDSLNECLANIQEEIDNNTCKKVLSNIIDLNNFEEILNNYIEINNN